MPDARKLYLDLMSQPCRAVLIFCRCCGIEVEEVKVKIAKKEHQTPEFYSINPLGKLPCLQEGQFLLPESAAILRYLAATNSGVAFNWYPDDPRRRALVDAALDWQHANVRGGAARLVFHRVLTRNMGGPFRSDPLLAKQAENTLRAAIQHLEDFWLKGRQFVAGNDISIADLLICCELEQLVMLGADPQGAQMADYITAPVAAYMQRVAATTAPHYDAVSKFLRSAAANMQRAASSKL